MGRNVDTPIVSVVAPSGTGKTTLVERLITELVARGYRVATVKHHRHAVDVDVPGKDSWRHARAGAHVTMIDSPEQFVAIARVDRQRTRDELLAAAGEVDILISEGFQRGEGALIEVVRTAAVEAPGRPAADLFALVTDGAHAGYDDVPTFDLDDVYGIVDLVETRLLSSGDQKE